MSLFVRPTLGRALWTTPLVASLILAISVITRTWIGMTPVWDTQAILVVMWIGGFFGFLIGIGGFDYWSRWMIGSPTKPEDHSQHGATSWRSYFSFNTDHKVIGLQYIGTTLIFFLIAGLFAEIFRAQLARPNSTVVDPQTYNGLMSQHATLMTFLFVIPIFAGIGNYVIPLMLGAPDMAFPRLNAVSFWMLPFAGVTFLASFLFGSFDTGWTGYTPLSTLGPMGQDLFSIGVQFAGASSIAAAVNFIVTIITMRAPGMTFFRLPLLVWSNMATSVLVCFATPFIAGVQFMSLFDRVLGTHFFAPDSGGAVLAYQHIFWFYSHPAVYIMMIPGFGIISEVIVTNSRKPIFGYKAVAFSTVAISVLGYSVWAHHMFVSGMNSWLRVPMMISSALIAVPTGIKIFSWLGTLYRGVIQMNTAMLFAMGFIWTFLMGGLTGVMIAAVPFDVSISNTYFIVGHIHYVLYGGSVMTIWAGLYYWFPKVSGRMLNERLGKFHFWATFICLNGTFMPMHWLGMEGMPRRVPTYAAKFQFWNEVITFFGFGLGAATLIFIYNMIHSWRHGRIAGPNPWRSLTMEWLVSSPPPTFNFEVTPRVVGGPYRYGEPGAHHAIIPDVPTTTVPTVTKTLA